MMRYYLLKFQIILLASAPKNLSILQIFQPVEFVIKTMGSKIKQ